MSFLNKCACTALQVLSLNGCPLDNVPHMPSDYPIYYDALYFPWLHPSVFNTSNLFCQWLPKAMIDHWCGSHACSCVSSMWPFSIGNIDGCFTVTFGQHSMSLSTADVVSWCATCFVSL